MQNMIINIIIFLIILIHHLPKKTCYVKNIMCYLPATYLLYFNNKEGGFIIDFVSLIVYLSDHETESKQQKEEKRR